MEMGISVEDSLFCSGSYSYPVGINQTDLLNSEDRSGLDKSRGWTDEERQGNPGKIYGSRPVRQQNDRWTEAVTRVVGKLLGTAGWKGFALDRKILGRKTKESTV